MSGGKPEHRYETASTARPNAQSCRDATLFGHVGPVLFDHLRPRAYDYVMEFSYDPDFNQRLFDSRGVTFDDALESLCAGDVMAHFSYPDQKHESERHVLIVSIGGTACFLPYLLSDKGWYLETVCPCEQTPIPNRPATAAGRAFEYLSEEEQAVIERLRRLSLKTLPDEIPGELPRMKRAAKKFLRRERKGQRRVGPYQASSALWLWRSKY